MNYLELVFNLPYAVFWLPISVFLVVVGPMYFLTRPKPSLVAAGPVEEAEAVRTVKSGEQRTAFRRAGNPVQVYVAAPGDKANPETGCVLDRSVGGMRLAVYHEVEPGTILSIRPLRADTIVPWIDLEVRSCRISADMTGQFEVGCQYVKSPPYSLQLIFG